MSRKVARMTMLCFLVGGALSVGSCWGDETARDKGAPAGAEAAKSEVSSPDPVFVKLTRLVGGKWVNVPQDPQRPIVIEYRYEMAMGGQAVRGLGVLAKGTPGEVQTEAIFGWDPVHKNVYYMDFHGHETVYKGTIRSTETGFATEFETIVGPPAQYRSRSECPDDDTIHLSHFTRRNGEWVPVHKTTLKRHR